MDGQSLEDALRRVCDGSGLDARQVEAVLHTLAADYANLAADAEAEED
jgi:hypothetical protein